MNIYSNKRRPVKAGATLERENDMEIVLRDDDGAQLRVVYRPNVKGYVIRRTLNDGGNGRFEWDQSKEIYDTAEEAKQAALDGRVTFNFKRRKTPPLPVKSSTRRRSVKCNAGKLDDIAYVMQNYINGNGFVLEQDLGNGKYVVSYQGTPVTIEFDPSFSEYVYFINGEGPYSHNSYEYIYDDIREYVDSITDEWGNVIASANKAVKASDFEFIYDIPEDEEDADDMSGAYYYDVLTPEQQQYVVDNWEKLLPTDTLYQWHSDDTMDWYHYDISELAKEYEKQYGLNIDVNKIYWNCGSQGPSPQWRLSNVINKTYISDVGNIRDIDIAFEGSLTVEGYASYWIDNGDGGHYDYEILTDELSDMGVDQMAIDAIEAEINAAQEFVDKTWELINDVCRSYPDDDWVQGMLEGNPQIFTFYVDEDGVVEDASL